MTSRHLLRIGRDKLPGEMSWWFEPGNKVERFAGDIIALCRDGGSLAERSGLMLLAIQWHMEKNRPLPAALLKALACVLDLVIWKDGRPVPAMAIRDCLGLPHVRAVEEFLAVARANPDVSNSELARQLGIGHNTVGRWRADPDFGKWSTAGQDVFFPFGLPANIEMAAEDEVIEAINAYCHQFELDRFAQQEWRRRQPSSLSVEPRVNAFRLALDSAAKQVPLSEAVLWAIARLLGAISVNRPDSTPVPLDKHILRRLGLPEDVKELAAFLGTARQDGEALAADLQTLPYEQLCAEVDRQLASGKWALPVSHAAGWLQRSTIRSWRGNPAYRRFARSAALWPALVEHVWSLPKWKKRR